VVNDVLQDDQSLQRQEFLNAMPLLAVQRGQCAAMYMEARYLLREILGNDIDGSVGPSGEHIAQARHPALSQQERPGPVSGVYGATDHLCALGDEETLFGLQVSTERGIPEVDIVGQSGVCGLGDGEPHYDPPLMHIVGTLDWQPALDHSELMARPVRDAIVELELDCFVAPIDPNQADTAAFCAAYEVPLEVSANCVVVAGRRADVSVMAACLVRATDRADVNRVIRKRLDVRKISFAGMDDAVRETGMEYGGITPIGLPASWPILVDEAVAALDMIVVGSGIRGSKIAMPGRSAASLPYAEVLPLALSSPD
jgi:prolyl-tRNA editing enzyme YbaK/EbsC (Cys-tRNA(Pro) deacylase)